MAEDFATSEVFAMSYSPECVVFVVDLDQEMSTPLTGAGQAGPSRMETIKEALKSFVLLKISLNQEHKFGLAVIRDQPEWRCPLTSDTKQVLTAISALHPAEANYPRFDMASLITLADRQRILEEHGKRSKVRMLLVYSRSNTVPSCSMPRDSTKAQMVDLLYLHDKPQNGMNCPQQVYDALTQYLDAWAYELGFCSYIFEAPSSQSAPRKVKMYMAQLLSHPLQRFHQDKLPKAVEISRLNLSSNQNVNVNIVEPVG